MSATRFLLELTRNRSVPVVALIIFLPMTVSAEEVKRPPPPDAVWDVRYACLYGEYEGTPLNHKQRADACDDFAKLESEALEIGYCWNQGYAEYRLCKTSEEASK